MKTQLMFSGRFVKKLFGCHDNILLDAGGGYQIFQKNALLRCKVRYEGVRFNVI